jgi:NAD-dependent SIR2 family protein deacetylase
MSEVEIRRAADAIASAEALIVAAGAGMGVDSGLPDFRGREGFWNAYPPYRQLGLSFEELANPEWFESDPALAWGFYGHRLGLYRRTRPHRGFATLLRWAGRVRHGAFVITSNVDGQFQRAGFPEERICEVHGAIDWLQCTRRCGVGVFEAGRLRVHVDRRTFRAQGTLPTCSRCGALARPNILMFDDFEWDGRRTSRQRARLKDWLAGLGEARIVVVECGAGTAVATIRRTSEALVEQHGAALVRINPREWRVPAGQIGIAAGAAEALAAIDAALAG